MQYEYGNDLRKFIGKKVKILYNYKGRDKIFIGTLKEVKGSSTSGFRFSIQQKRQKIRGLTDANIISMEVKPNSSHD
jgi:hypothetical protein